MRVRHPAAAALAAIVLATGLAACGGGGGGGTDDDSSSTGGTALTIFTSLPQQGLPAGEAESVLRAEQMALKEAGGRVGEFTIQLRVLDDAKGSDGHWDPGTTAGNARDAAQENDTIAYIGDLDSGATAISLPILNEARILQVSPASTLQGLTTVEGADKGEPDKYYPGGDRTFVRVVPGDAVQTQAQVTIQLARGCSSLFIVHDTLFYGARIARTVGDAAKARGLDVVGSAAADPDGGTIDAVVADVAKSQADCLFYGGVTESHAAELWNALHRAVPTLRLFGPDGVAEHAFTSQLTAATQRQATITSPALDPSLLPDSAARFFAAYREEYGEEPEPYAIYGYEAMKLTLEAIRAAGPEGNDRRKVIDAAFRTRDRDSVLGTYSITRNGDTTLNRYGAWSVAGGRLVWDRAIPPRR